jgi:hypothetical protein
MIGVAPIPPERSSISRFCHRVTPFTAGSPFVDQSEGTTQVTVTALQLNCMSLQRNIRKTATVQIWMNFVYRSEGVHSTDLINSSREWGKLNALYNQVDKMSMKILKGV